MVSYRCVVVDPPWRYNDKEPFGGHGGAERHYKTMSLAEIADLPIRDLTDPTGAHCYLWTTNPFIFEARALLEAWGFRYATLLTWHKIGSIGLGHYFRGDTEHVLFGIRGRCPIPPALRVSNHFASPRRAHSAKPDRFYEIVERVSPEPRMELFARRRRIGWDVWGDEAPPESEARTQTHMALVP